MPTQNPAGKPSGRPWKALYKGKWYDVLDVVDQGSGKQNKYKLKGVPGEVDVEDVDPFGIGGKVADKEKILSILQRRYGEETRASLESVATDIYYSGEPAAVLASNALVEKLFNQYHKTQREIDAKNAASVDSNEFCPICKMATANIKLAGNRPAKWCSRHFVVFPIRGDKKRDEDE